MKNNTFYSVDEAQKILENYCAYQERCHKEVENKLSELKMIPEAKEKIILHLIQRDFLNEERFSKAYARGKFYQKNWGKLKIKKELHFRNISTYNINSALNEIDANDYYETLKNIAEKKAVLIKESNSYKKKQKLITYLISKGYETQLIYEVVNDIL